MSTKNKATKNIQNVNVANENLELNALLDTLNASNAINNVSTNRNYSTERIWLKSFRDSQKNGKISTSVRNNLANKFGIIANFVKAGKLDQAKKEYENLLDWSKDKLTNLEFDKFENYSSKDISNSDLFKFGTETYNRNADCINSGLTAIKVLRLQNIV